jgi:eukaryotic-like serine/threonine-protein kinase
MTEPQGIDSTLAGYRIVRRIASGSRADLFLGAGSTDTVVLKVFQSHVSRADVGAELDALGRLSVPHVVSLRDVSSAAGPLPIAILERVSRGSIAQLLRDRQTLELGEAVTLLAPLGATLPLLHAAGVAHTRIGATTVHLGASGQPVILGFGHTALFKRGASVAVLDAEAGASADRDALALLATVVLERVRDVSAPAIRRLLDWLRNEPRRCEFGSELEHRLFEIAEPQPIEFGRSSIDALPARAVEVSRASPVEVSRTRPVAEALEAPEPARLPDWLDELLVKSPLAAIRERTVGLVKGVRRRYWFIAGGVVLALILATSLVPTGSTAAPPAAASIATPSSRPVPSETPLPADPLEALPLLLAARNTCVRDLSVLCLDEVDEASSGAYLSDAAAIRQLEAGGTAESSAIITGAEPKLVERLGDTVLLDLGGHSDPASVLMIKTEAGWRIRDFLSGKHATP